MLDATTEVLAPSETFRERCGAIEDAIVKAFDRHQWALAIHDLDAAETELRRYRHGLETFLQEERSVLLPLYARTGSEDAGPVESYLEECADLENEVAILCGDLRRLRESPPPRGVNPLLRAEADFLVLATRHFLRMRHRLFPTLDRMASADERRRLLPRLDVVRRDPVPVRC